MPTNAMFGTRVAAMNDDNDTLTEQYLRDAARDEGLSYHDFCQKYGIVGPSQARKQRRHEVNESDVSAATRRDINSRTVWGDGSLKTPNASVITAKAPPKPAPRRKRDDE